MDPYHQPLNIKAWAEEDRPREKLLLQGKQALTEAELLAILIGSGTTKETAVHLCQRILADYEHNLHALGRLSVHQLMQYRGIGQAKAITIVAALELGRRRQAAERKKKPHITASRDVYELMQPVLGDLPHEEFHMLYLNRSNKVLLRERVSVGGVTGTVADIKLMLKTAVNALACGMIACHNHPSGSLHPSHADIKLTKKLKEAGEWLDVKLLDHLIITDEGYYSFADEGQL